MTESQRNRFKACRVLRRLFKKRFVGVHIGYLFRDQFRPYYVLNLGSYSYYYFIILDWYNEMSLSLSTTSYKMIEKLLKSLESKEPHIIVGKYALTYQDRLLTCGSLKLLSSKSLTSTKFKYVAHAVEFVETGVKTPYVFSQLALFTMYTTKKSRDDKYVPLYNRNSCIIVSPEGHSCYAGFILGSITSEKLEFNTKHKSQSPPHIKIVPYMVLGIKAIACRPDTQDPNAPIKCRSVRIQALVNESLISVLKECQNKTCLIFVNWCPDLGERRAIIMGIKPLSGEELASYLLGKVMLLSSFEITGDDVVYRVLMPEDRLRNHYKCVLNHLKYRLGTTVKEEMYNKVLIDHVKHCQIIKFLRKKTILPLSLKLYLHLYSWLSLDPTLRNHWLEQILRGKEAIHLSKKSSKVPVVYTGKILAIKPLASTYSLMII